MRKLHVQRATASNVTSWKVSKMAENTTFWDISRNVVIKALWFSELSMGVMSTSFCWISHPFKTSRFRVIQFARGSKCPEIRPFEMSRNRFGIRSYQKFLVSCIHVEANRNYIYAKTACPKSNRFPCYKPKSVQNGRKHDFLRYISKCSNQGFMVFWIEYVDDVGLILLKTTSIQNFSFQSYSICKGVKMSRNQTLRNVS